MATAASRDWPRAARGKEAASGPVALSGVDGMGRERLSPRARGNRKAASLVLCVGAAGAAIGAAQPFVDASSASASAPHIMVIVDENQEYRSIIGSPSAPYINSLAGTYTSATNWYAVEHNSPTDYLDLTTGSDQGLAGATNKKPPFTATSIVDELHSASIPWQAYMESMPSSCSTTGSTPDGLYDRNHNPFTYLKSYASYCANEPSEGVLPYSGAANLVKTLDGASPPDFVFVAPNECDDMHGGVNGSAPCNGDTNGQLIAAGDTWLRNNLGPILSSTWFQNNGVVIFTFDEGGSHLGVGTPPDDGSCGTSATSGCGGHIVTLVITPRAGGAFPTTGDHYGTLRGIEEAYGLPYLAHAASNTDGDISAAFALTPSPTPTPTPTSTPTPTPTPTPSPTPTPTSGPDVVQSFSAASTALSSTLSDSTAQATAPGDLLVAVITLRDTVTLATVRGLADSGANTWTKLTSHATPSQLDEEVWYSATTQPSQSVTVTVTDASGVVATTVLEVAGTSSPDQRSASGGSSTAAGTGPTANTIQVPEIAVADVGWVKNVTTSAQTPGYTALPKAEAAVSGAMAGEQAAYRILTVTGPQSYGATLSSSVAWGAAIATFS